LGGSRSTAVPSATLLAPKRAKFYGASPLFSWTFAGHNEGYVLIITDEDEAQLEKHQTKDAHLSLDTSKAKFQPGETYYWRVRVLPTTRASDPLEFVWSPPPRNQPSRRNLPRFRRATPTIRRLAARGFSSITGSGLMRSAPTMI